MGIMISFNNISNDITTWVSTIVTVQIQKAQIICGHLPESQEVVNVFTFVNSLSPSQDRKITARTGTSIFLVPKV